MSSQQARDLLVEATLGYYGRYARKPSLDEFEDHVFSLIHLVTAWQVATFVHPSELGNVRVEDVSYRLRGQVEEHLKFMKQDNQRDIEDRPALYGVPNTQFDQWIYPSTKQAKAADRIDRDKVLQSQVAEITGRVGSTQAMAGDLGQRIASAQMSTQTLESKLEALMNESSTLEQENESIRLVLPATFRDGDDVHYFSEDANENILRDLLREQKTLRRQIGIGARPEDDFDSDEG